MEKEKGKEIIDSIDRKKMDKEALIARMEEVERWKEKERKEDPNYMVPINCVSKTELKAHVKEMRLEIDRKIVEYFMSSGLNRAESIKKVRVLNVELGYDQTGI